MEYELRYRTDEGKQRTAIVQADNVSAAVARLLELQPGLKGNPNRIKSCTRVINHD